MRLYPSYFVGFMLTLSFVLLSSYYFGNDFPYTVKEMFYHSIIGLRDLFETKNIDMIIWTLELELKFYLLCLLFLPLFHKRSLWVFAIPLMVFGLLFSFNVLYAWHTLYPLPLLIYMFIGTVFYYHLKGTLSRYVAVFLVVTLYLLYGMLYVSIMNPKNQTI